MRASKYNLNLAAASLLLSAWAASGQVIITNVQTVNVTPTAFSVLAAVSPSLLSSTSTAIAIFSDPNGVTNLAGQVGVEMYPLNSGDPTATNSYQILSSRTALQEGSMSLGLIHARVSSCTPGTTYYYQISVTNGGGQSAVWPPNGQLPSAITASENSFVLPSQQLLITVGGAYPPGSIITLSASNSASTLAAVVGDGAGNNQAFFNLNDLIAASGGTNYAPFGSQIFTASIFNQTAFGPSRTYELAFGNSFSVGQNGVDTLDVLATAITIGSSAVLAGHNGAIPISLNAQGPLVGLSFVLNLPTNLFTAISLVPTAPALNGASVTLLSSNAVQLSFQVVTGGSLLGNQQIAQLNLTAISNPPSAFVPLSPQTAVGTNADLSLTEDFTLQSGRAVIIGAQSLLEMLPGAGGLNLVLYGIPGDSYEIQTTTNLTGKWSNYLLVPMTNLTQVFPNLARTAPAEFYRAYSFNADPPLLQASLAGTRRSLLTYGIPGTNYTLLTASSLSLPVVWSPLLSYTLTNSFQSFTNLGSTSPVFYRLRKQ